MLYICALYLYVCSTRDSGKVRVCVSCVGLTRTRIHMLSLSRARGLSLSHTHTHTHLFHCPSSGVVYARITRRVRSRSCVSYGKMPCEQALQDHELSGIAARP